MLKNSIDKIVKDKLDGVGVEPPSYVWSSINQYLLEDKHRKRILFYWQSVAAIALIVLSVGIIYFISERSVSEIQMVKVEAPVEVEVRGIEVEKKGRGINESYVYVTSGLETTAEVADNKNIVSVIQPKMICESKMERRIFMAKMNYLQAFVIEGEVPNAKLYLPERSLSKSSVFNAYNIVIPTYSPKLKRYHFAVGGSVSPTYNYRNVNEFQNSSVVRSTYGSPTNESGVVSMSGGVSVRLEGKSRWSFETGVLYSQIGQEVSQAITYTSISGVSAFANVGSDNMKSISIVSVDKFNNSMGIIRYNNNTSMGVEQTLLKNGVYLEAPVNSIGNQPESMNLKQLLDYIEVPLMARYFLFDSKPTVTLVGGFSTNFLVDNNVYIVDNGEHVNAGETEGISGIAYSSSVGIGLELPLGKSIRFSLEPRFKYYLSPVNSQGYSSFRPYSFGVFGGISVILNNH